MIDVDLLSSQIYCTEDRGRRESAQRGTPKDSEVEFVGLELVDVELATPIRYVTKPFFLLLSASLERYGEEEEAAIISI